MVANSDKVKEATEVVLTSAKERDEKKLREKREGGRSRRCPINMSLKETGRGSDALRKAGEKSGKMQASSHYQRTRSERISKCVNHY